MVWQSSSSGNRIDRRLRRNDVRASSLLLIALLVAACGVPTTDPGVSSTVPPTTVPSTLTSTVAPTSTMAPGETNVDPDVLDLVVVPDSSGGFPPDLMVGCHGHTLFPLSALDEIETIPADDPDGHLAAIEPFLANEEGQFWPQDGWQLLWTDDSVSYLVTKTEEGSLAWMHLERDGSGWKWAGSSIGGDPCQLRVGVPTGMNTVEWRIDPNHPEPSAETTRVHLILNERECVDGREIGDRLRGPQVVLTSEEVRIVFVAETPDGDFFTCPGNPDTPFVLELPEPLGDRELVDGFEVGLTLDDYVD